MSKNAPRIGPQERRPGSTNNIASRSAIAASLSDAEVRRASGTVPGRRFLERIGLKPKATAKTTLAKAARKAAKLRAAGNRPPGAGTGQARINDLSNMSSVEFGLFKAGGPAAVAHYRKRMGRR
jgi:hypothetical protein